MILTPEELTRDPHAMAIGLFEEHQRGRPDPDARHPTRFSATPAHLSGGSPALGEHTDDLAELGGDRSAELRESGVVA